MEKYVLTLNREQAEVVSRACSLLSRLCIGQFRELRWEFINMNYNAGTGEDYFKNNWAKVDKLLDELRSLAFPGCIKNTNYDSVVGNVPMADNAYNVHQVLRYQMAYHDHPEGRDTVNFHKPIQLGPAEIPKCKVVQDDVD